jgi:hypothetical protein
MAFLHQSEQGYGTEHGPMLSLPANLCLPQHPLKVVSRKQ